MRRRNSRAKGIAVGVALLVIAVAAGAFLASRGSLERPQVGGETTETANNVVRQKKYPRVEVYVMKTSGSDVYLAPETVKVKPGTDMHEAAILELVETSRWEGESKNLIPQGTKLLSLDIQDGVAVVNFSREFVDNFNGGARLEALTIHSVVHTLTQFEDVQSVRMLVEGEKLETLGGHLDTSEPIAADHTLLLEGSG